MKFDLLTITVDNGAQTYGVCWNNAGGLDVKQTAALVGSAIGQSLAMAAMSGIMCATEDGALDAFIGYVRANAMAERDRVLAGDRLILDMRPGGVPPA